MYVFFGIKKSHFILDFVYFESPLAPAGHKFFAVWDFVALNNSSTNNLGQFQCGLNLSTYFSKLWCILSGACVEILPNP